MSPRKWPSSVFGIMIFGFLLGLTSVVVARPPITVEVVSVSSAEVQGNGDNFLGHISHDGRYVAFLSRSNNLSADDPNIFVDLYLRDRVAGTTIRIAPITLNNNPIALSPAQISANGDWVVFGSFASLVPEDTNTLMDIYLYNRVTDTIQLVSSGTGFNDARNVSLSYNACAIVYDIGLNGLYLYDRSTGATQLIDPNGLDPQISDDGNFIVYALSGGRQLQLYDRTTGIIRQIEATESISPAISGNGNLIVYEERTQAPESQIVAYNRITNVYTNLTVYQNNPLNGRSFDSWVNADGSWVVFGSFADDLVPGPDTVTGDVFAYEMATGAIERLSLLPNGNEPNGRSDIPIISGDGQHILFQSEATDFINPDTNGGISDVLVGDYGLVNVPVPTVTDTCTPVPIYDSDPLPNATILLTGAPGTTVTEALNIQNIGDAGSLLNVTQTGALTDFTITGGLPINNLTLADGVTPVSITCTIPATGTITETLILQSNEINNPTYSYTLQCAPNTTPQLAITDVAVDENALVANFVITLSDPLGVPLTFTITSGDGTATAGLDYEAVPVGTQLTIPAGDLTVTYPVTILQDAISESTENFMLSIAAPSVAGVLITDADAVGTIADDDALPATLQPTSVALGSTPLAPNINVFDPAISKIGFLLPGQIGVTGEKLEWVVTVSNTGNTAGLNVVITDTLDSRLQIDRVQAPGGNVNVSGQTVTITYPIINPGQTVQLSIFTTVLNGVTVNNTACITATNMTAPKCATGLRVSHLPDTGETPWWQPLIILLTTGAGLVLLVRRMRQN